MSNASSARAGSSRERSAPRSAVEYWSRWACAAIAARARATRSAGTRRSSSMGCRLPSRTALALSVSVASCRQRAQCAGHCASWHSWKKTGTCRQAAGGGHVQARVREWGRGDALAAVGSQGVRWLEPLSRGRPSLSLSLARGTHATEQQRVKNGLARAVVAARLQAEGARPVRGRRARLKLRRRI
eukprot:7044416-Prymnesium_polylepis.1